MKQNFDGKPVLDFFDASYNFDSIKSIDTKKHEKTSKKPIEYVLSVISKVNNKKEESAEKDESPKKEESPEKIEYRILYKTKDDLRRDYFVNQALELIVKVSKIYNRKICPV